jgi:thiamine phosphate synthase YjbQ (UPF0047 family)
MVHGSGATKMKAFTHYLTLNIPGKMTFVNITPEVAQAIRDSGVQEGIVLVNTMQRSEHHCRFSERFV